MAKSVTSVTGFLIPIEWDKHQIVVKVGIMTDSFEKYIIVDSEPVFAESLNKKIKAKGIVIGEDLTGNKIIKLLSHNILN